MSDSLVLKGGRLFDPSIGLDTVQDVRIEGARITEIGADLRVPYRAQEVRLQGALVTPGLIDTHIHVHPEGTVLSIEADTAGVHDGVTTVVDAGCAGAYTFPGFRRWVVERAATRVLCWLNVGASGLLKGELPEVNSPECFDVEATLQTIEANRDVIRGVKVKACRRATGTLGLEAVRKAKEIARAAGVPLLAHVGEMRGASEDAATITAESIDLLDAGDVVSHPFTPTVGGLFTRDGRLLPEVRAANERGVLFDAAFGRSSRSWRLLQTWLDQGLRVDTLSSDLSMMGRKHMVFSLPLVLSQFMAAGFSLAEVITRATANPARALGLDGEVGIRVGGVADLSVMELLEGEWRFVDTDRVPLTGRQMLSPILSVRAGNLHPALTSRVHATDRYE